MKKPKSAYNVTLGAIRRLKDKRELREALKGILDTEDGKLFWKHFLKHCHITQSVFDGDPYKIVEKESLRRLAMSYLHLIAKDNPDYLLEQLEAQVNRKD